MIYFGEYLPDQPELNNPGATAVKNVLPRTERSYGPLGALSPVSDALSARPQGAAAYRDSIGNVSTFAGDATDLYLLDGTTWDEISKSTGAYTVAADDAVEFIKFGTRVIAALGHSNPLQSYTLGSSSAFADLAAAAPRARHLAVIEPGFVMAGNTWDSSGGAVPNQVWWSALNDATDWPTIGSSDAAAKQSDKQELPVGGWVRRVTGAIGGLQGAVFMEKAIYRIQYEGPPTVFGFYEVERDRGTPAPGSVVNVGPFGFYLGEEGFYAFDGSGSTPIGDQKVDKTFFNDLDQSYFNRIYGGGDPINKMVFWAYPGAGNTGGRPNKLIIYNWSIGRWSIAEVEGELLFRDLTPGYTLDGLDNVSTDLDALPFSLDSRIWTDGSLVLSMFDADSKLARFSGDALAAEVETTEASGDVLFRKPHERILVNGIRPYVDAADQSDVTVTLRSRANPGATYSNSGPNAIDANGEAHFSVSNRYHRARVSVAAGASWSHAQGVDYDASEDGEV